MRNRIKYFCYYSDGKDLIPRSNCLASSNKIDYIISAINRNGYSVDIVSNSYVQTDHLSYAFGEVKKKEDGNTLRYFPSFGSKNKIVNKLGLFYKMFFFIIWFLLHVKRGEKIIVYHSLGYMNLISLLLKIKKAYLVLEVEEIYADVIGSSKIRKKELHFFEKANSYLFPTEILDNIINTTRKPSLIVYGTYQVEKKISDTKFKDGKIHLVYAGTLDPRKGGSQMAVSIAEYLSSEYHVHILGFGSIDEVESIQQQIDLVQSKTAANVTYDGILTGDDYIRFLQSCHIGLSTQYSTGSFNETSFPSKVLSYLGNGLRVVSIKIKVLEKSKLNDLLYYYQKDSPCEIAKVIETIDVSSLYNSRKTLQNLDLQFTHDIATFLQ